MPVRFADPPTPTVVFDDEAATDAIVRFDEPAPTVVFEDDRIADKLGKIPFVANILQDDTLSGEQKDEILAEVRRGINISLDKGDTLSNRFKQNRRDSFFGVNGVGTLAGAFMKTQELGNSLRAESQVAAVTLDNLNAEKIRRDAGGEMAEFSQNRLEMLPTPEINRRIKELQGRSEEMLDRFEATRFKGFKRQALRVGEFAGLPESEGIVDAMVGFAGQLAGGLATPENLIPLPGGPATGPLFKQLLKRFAIGGAGAAGANIATEPLVQRVAIKSKLQTDYSLSDAAQRTGIGFVLGGTVNVGLDLSARGVRNLLGNDRVIAREVAQAAVDQAETIGTLDKPSGVPRPLPDEQLVHLNSPVLEGPQRSIEALLSPISTRLNKIAPQIFARARKHEFDLSTKINQAEQRIKPFIQKKNKRMSRAERDEVDLLLKNARMEEAGEIVAKHDLTEEFIEARRTFEDLYKQAKEVGIETGYIDGYWPRNVKDADGYFEFLYGEGGGGFLDRALRDAENKSGGTLSVQERTEVVDHAIRGIESGQINAGIPANLRQRKIKELDAAKNQFYDTADRSAGIYVRRLIENIEKRKFFGQALVTEEGRVDVDKSVGRIVAEILQERPMRPSQQLELQQILRARFQQRQPNSYVQGFRNFTYATTLGSPINALTQVGDMAWSAYFNGYYNTFRTALSKKAVKMEDIGVSRIAAEFSSSGSSARAVNFIFDITGFSKIDKLGKETFINGALTRMRKQVKSPRGERKVREKFKDIMGPELNSFIKDIKNDVVSDNVRFALFNELSDVQPITLLEVPQVYLSAPNGRIFYALKTFTIRQLDVYRRESLSRIRAGVREKSPLKVIDGIQRMVRLASAFVVVNASVDEVKDFLLNRETDISDRLVDNLLRAGGISKYTVWQARRMGLSTVAKDAVMFPTPVVDDAFRDIQAMAQGEFDAVDSKTIKNIPWFGKFFYWHYGAGSKLNDEKRE